MKYCMRVTQKKMPATLYVSIDNKQHRAWADPRQKECIDMVEMLNRQIELIFKYWDGEITEEEFYKCKLFSISEEVDKEAQIDRFY